MSALLKEVSAYAPGKIMIAGEWAILDLGNPCIVLATDKGNTLLGNTLLGNSLLGVTATISSSKHFLLDKVLFDYKDNKVVVLSKLSSKEQQFLSFSFCAIEIVLRYLREIGHEVVPFKIFIDSSISFFTLPDGSKVKPGLGSSAALVVAITKCILKFYGFSVETEAVKKIVFKLSSIVHYKTQGSIGSCFDIAASTYGGLLYYKRFDAEWLEQELSAEASINKIISQKWPYLEIKKILLPEKMKIVVGFVGYSADTRKLVKKVMSLRGENKEAFEAIFSSISRLVDRLVEALEQGNQESIKKLVKKNRILLREFSDLSGLDLETKELKTLCDFAESCGGVAKFSGAGGGDCGIAICFDEKIKESIIRVWEKEGVKIVAALGAN